MLGKEGRRRSQGSYRMKTASYSRETECDRSLIQGRMTAFVRGSSDLRLCVLLGCHA